MSEILGGGRSFDLHLRFHSAYDCGCDYTHNYNYTSIVVVFSTVTHLFLE